MNQINNQSLAGGLYRSAPIILLFISVLNEFDFNNLEFKYFSFNFSYILIFYFSLKRNESLGYTYVFIAGLFNDVVMGTPIGISSFSYLLLCGAAAYLRNITLRPSLIKDWVFFLLTILVVNSFYFILLNFFFNHETNFLNQLFNILFTFLLYFVFSYLFTFFDKAMLGTYNVR